MSIDQRIKSIGLALTVLVIDPVQATAQLDPPQTCDPYPYIGSICWTVTADCPEGYVAAQGQGYSPQDMTSLYSLLGSNYGWSGRNTYYFPDLRGTEMIGSGQAPGLTAFKLGQWTGPNSILYSELEVPAHDHDIDFSQLQISGEVSVVSDYDADTVSPTEGLWAPPVGGWKTYDKHSNTTMAPGMVSGNLEAEFLDTASFPEKQESGTVMTGGPKLVLTACIAYKGQYPSPN
ncbi:MAG: phage tail protein [Magnetovibrionaceae bacterium]